MRLSLLLPCVVMGGLIGASVFGQSREVLPIQESFGKTVIQAAEPTAAESFDQDVPSTAESVVQEEQELRRQYRKLVELKSDLMDRSALRAAINGAVQDVNELRAAEKLDEARVNLLELVKMHPDTKAAATARAMLQATPEKVRFQQNRGTPYGPFTAPSNSTFENPTPTFIPSGDAFQQQDDASHRTQESNSRVPSYPSKTPSSRRKKTPTAQPAIAPFYQPNPKRKTIDD